MAVILHVDMDAFYAAVELLDHPEYCGLPLIVGGEKSSRRGVVATCSYEARKFGVHSAMSIPRAVQLCPQGIFIPTRMERYQEVSRQIHGLFDEFSPVVEPLSVDEAFLDMTGCEHFYESLEDMGQRIKERIRSVTGVTASVGIAPNKFLAKLASDHNKPDGLLVLRPEDTDPFLLSLPVKKLWGVGQVAQRQLAQRGIYTIRDLRQRSQEWLEKEFGNFGIHIFQLARGIDERKVEPAGQAKSIGQELTFDDDYADEDTIKGILSQLADKVGWRLRKHSLYTRTIVLKVRTPEFSTYTRSFTLKESVQDNDTLFNTAWRLYQEFKGQPLRLIGITAANLGREGQQLSLFDDNATGRKLSEVMDALNDRYESTALTKGRSLLGRRKETQRENEPPR